MNGMIERYVIFHAFSKKITACHRSQIAEIDLNMTTFLVRFFTKIKKSENFGSEHEFGRFRTSNALKVEILDLSTNLEDLGPVIYGKWKFWI